MKMEPLPTSTPQQAAHGFILPPIAKAGYHQIDIGPTAIDARYRSGAMRNDCRHHRRRTRLGIGGSNYMACVRPMTAESVTWRELLRLAEQQQHSTPPRSHSVQRMPCLRPIPDHFSPYSPSNRIFYNPLHADAATIFGDARVAKAKSDAARHNGGVRDEASLINWPRATRLKMAVFRRLFEEFLVRDFSANPRTALGKISPNSARAKGRRWPHTLYLKRCTPPDCGPTHAIGTGRPGRRNGAIPRAAARPRFCRGERAGDSFPLLPAMDRGPLFRRGAAKSHRCRACASALSPISRSA